MWSTTLLLLLPDPLRFGVVVSIRVPVMGRIICLKFISILQDMCKNTLLRNSNTKKCEYERTINAIP